MNSSDPPSADSSSSGLSGLSGRQLQVAVIVEEEKKALSQPEPSLRFTAGSKAGNCSGFELAPFSLDVSATPKWPGMEFPKG
jgi:hypothetical protein